MPAQELIDYVNEQMDRGARAQDVQDILINQGWPVPDIEAVLLNYHHQTAIPPSPSPKANANQLQKMTSTNMTDNSETVHSQTIKNKPTKKVNKLVVIFIFIIIFLLSVTGVGAYWWTTQADQFLINRSVTQMSQIESLTYNGEIIINVEVKDPSLISSILPEPAHQILGHSTTSFEIDDRDVLAQGFYLDEGYGYPSDNKLNYPETTYPSIPIMPEIPQKFGMTIKFDGAAEGREWRTSKGQAGIEFDYEGFEQIIPNLENFALKFKFIDQILYFQISGLKYIGEVIGVSLDPIEDQWIMIDPHKLNQFDSYYSFTDFEESMDEQMEQYQIANDKISQLVSKYQIIQLSNKTISQQIDEATTIKADYTINKDLLDDFIVEIIKELYQDEELYGLRVQDWKEMQTAIQETLEITPEIQGQVWMGITDQLIRKITLDMPNIGNADEYQIDLYFEMNYSNLNQPQDIQPPEDTKDVQTIVEQMRKSIENSYTSPVTGVNPALQFAAARDSQRRSDLYAITNAVYQYVVENAGELPSTITTTPTDIGTSGLKLRQFLVPTYIADIPYDPTFGTLEKTGYVLFKTDDNRITASAIGELTENISVSR